MPRQTPPGRLEDIAHAACEVFIQKGYRRALMTDVAARLEINHALLYRYVESKDALLELAARYAMDQTVDPTTAVPLPTPPRGHTLDLLRNWIKAQAAFPVFRAALARSPDEDSAAKGSAAKDTAAKDTAAEFGDIIEEFYSFIQRARLALSLMNSLVIDYPEFNEMFVNESKNSQIERLAAYLSSRAATGVLRPLPDPEMAAHFIVESVAWFAMHRKDDPSTAAIDDDRARSSVRELLLSTFVPDAMTTGTGPGPASRHLEAALGHAAPTDPSRAVFRS
ncbi:MAG TPA: TetR/AcrR family transcriptional regulator [Streptosporangiaceae bacterium]|jgi:AcrR family transcriptional regulator|nr:TetR/AcrR family transcriptional regulator [Streptosporangiaceae bacterium]